MDVFNGLSDEAFSDAALGLAEPAAEDFSAEPTHDEQPNTPADAGNNQSAADPQASGLPADDAVVTPEEAPTDWKQQYEQADKRRRDNQAAYTRELQEKLQLQAQMAAMQAELQRLRDGVTAAVPGNKEDTLKNFLDNPNAFVNQAVSPLVKERVDTILKPIQEAAQRESAKRNYDAGMAEVMKSYPQLQGDKDAQKRVLEEALKLGQAMGDGNMWAKSPIVMQLAAIQAFGMPKEVNQAAISAAEERGKQAALAELAAKEAAKGGKTVNTTNNMESAEPMSEEDRIRAEIAAAHIGFGW